jgi:Flp pilus assembly protein CpaB
LILVLIVGAAIFAFVVLRGSNGPSADPNANAPAGTVAPAPSPTPTTRVVVARYALSQGTLIGENDLDTAPNPNPGPDDILADDINSVINHFNNIPLNRGQAIKKSYLVDGSFSNYMRQQMVDKKLELGKKAFAYATNDLSSVAGLIHEGDLVDVVASFNLTLRPVSVPGPNGTNIPLAGARTEATTKTLLQNVRVLKVIPLQLDRTAFDVPHRPLPTPTIDTSALTPVVVSGTPIPTPTLQGFTEMGAFFPITTVLVLAVSDQEAEVLKFARESSVVTCSSSGGNGSGSAGVAGCLPVVHFTLRARPIDPTKPDDTNISQDVSRGITLRALVRDYGVPIPDLVFATQAQQ